MKRYVFFGLLAAMTTLGPQGGRALAQVDSYSNQPGYKEALDFSFSRARLRMQQLGVPADTAKKAVWALRYKPKSDCAFLAQEVISSYEGPGSLGEGAILDMERYHLCEPQNLNKHKPQPARQPYDKNKDPSYQMKLFFRDHEQEARDILAKAGIVPQAIDNVVKVYAEDPRYAKGDYTFSECAVAAMHIIFKAQKDPAYRGYSIDNDLLKFESPRECDDPDPVYTH